MKLKIEALFDKLQNMGEGSSEMSESVFRDQPMSHLDLIESGF